MSYPKSIERNQFISKTIKQYIYDNKEKLTKKQVTLYVGNIIVNLYGCASDDELEAKEICEEVSRLPVASKKPIRCYVFLLDFPKQLDARKDNITCEECNSGSTTFYSDFNEVLVWRREEWQKVFYHELLHAVGVDRSILQISDKRDYQISNYLKHYNRSIHEAYTEILATLMYINRYSKEIKDNNVFLGTQVNKIIHFMMEGNMDYERFFRNPDRLLDNSTNTSSYYILKSIYLWNAVYKNKKLMDVGNLLNKQFANKYFYDTLIKTLKSDEYFKWLKKIYFIPKNSSMKLTY
jgi:hypothetical protein